MALVWLIGLFLILMAFGMAGGFLKTFAQLPQGSHLKTVWSHSLCNVVSGGLAAGPLAFLFWVMMQVPGQLLSYGCAFAVAEIIGFAWRDVCSAMNPKMIWKMFDSVGKLIYEWLSKRYSDNND